MYRSLLPPTRLGLASERACSLPAPATAQITRRRCSEQSEQCAYGPETPSATRVDKEGYAGPQKQIPHSAVQRSALSALSALCPASAASVM